MRRISWWAGVVVLLMITLGQAWGEMVYVNVPTLNIREEAGTQYKTIRSVPNGHPLKVLGEQGKWYKVELKDETVGWVHKMMVTSQMPDITKITQLESRLDEQTASLKEAKQQLRLQIKLNSKLNKQLEDAQQQVDKLDRQNQELQERNRIELAAIGVGMLLLGCVFGFLTGFFKRRTEDKRFIKMMIEANSLKK